MFKISFVAFPILSRSTALIGGSNNAAAYTATAAIQTAKSNALSMQPVTAMPNRRFLAQPVLEDQFGIISTFAGTGFPPYRGEGEKATFASLLHPSSIATDSDDNIHICDTDNNRVSKVNIRTGIITTIAGNGMSMFGGDNGPATNATLASPYGIAIDSLGNVLIADMYNNRVRMITKATGVITTIAGNGKYGFGGDGGPAIYATLASPSDVALDKLGNILIADRGNSRVRVITKATGVITTIAGNGTYSSNGDGLYPEAVAIDSKGDILVAGYGVKKITSSDIITIAAFKDLYCSSVAVDSLDNTYVTSGYVIWKLMNSTGNASIVVGHGTHGYTNGPTISGPEVSATTGYLSSVVIDREGIMFADYDNNRISKLTISTGNITTLAGSGIHAVNTGGNGPAKLATLNHPTGVTADTHGNIFIADSNINCIHMVNKTTNIITTFNGTIAWPSSGYLKADLYGNVHYTVKADSFGNVYYTGSGAVYKLTLRTGAITRFAGTGIRGFSGDEGPALLATLQDPYGLAIDIYGNVFIADVWNNRVRMVNVTNGIIASIRGYLTDRPFSLVFDALGFLYIGGQNTVQKVDVATGASTIVAGGGVYNLTNRGDGGLATSAYFQEIHGVAIDSSGNILISDGWLNNVIRRINITTGIIITIVGNNITGIGYDAYGYSGDEGSANLALLNLPSDICLDSSGTLYIADTYNNVIRMVDYSNLTPTPSPLSTSQPSSPPSKKPTTPPTTFPAIFPTQPTISSTVPPTSAAPTAAQVNVITQTLLALILIVFSILY